MSEPKAGAEHVYLAAGSRPDGFWLSSATCSCGTWQWDFDAQGADSAEARADWQKHVSEPKVGAG